MVVALLPIVGLSAYAYISVSHLLVTAANDQMRQASRTLGMSVIDRLNLHASTLEQLATSGDASATDLGGLIQLSAPPTTVDIASLGTPAEQRLERGGTLLRVVPGTPPHLELLAMRHRSNRVLASSVDNSQLWDNDIAPNHFCVLTRGLKTLYCSPSLRSATLVRTLKPVLTGAGTGTFDYRADKREYLAGFWEVSLQPSFGNDGLIFVVMKDRARALGALAGFKLFFFAIALLALAIAAWLAIGQIRRQLRPLTSLMESTGRLAQGDFSTPAEVRGRDEFAGLSRAFNRMAVNLRDKFRLLSALARLDREILGVSLMQDVIRTLLAGVHQVIPEATAFVVHVDTSGHCAVHSAQRMRTVPRTEAGQLRAAFSSRKSAPWREVPEDDAVRSCLAASGLHAGDYVLAFPAFHDKRCIAELVLGFERPPEPQEDVIDAARALTDRLTVAAAKLAAEEALLHQAHHDALTNLPNRVLLRDRAEQALERSWRNGTVVALLLADFDKFKEINDALGHAAGDRLLEMCAGRLERCVRGSDTVARFGGDEFIILLPDLDPNTAVRSTARIAEDLNAALSEPVDIQGIPVKTVASIGISLYPDNATGFEDLLRMADAAMYEAKRTQGLRFCFYSHSMNVATRQRFELSQELRSAIEQGEMVLYYQPRFEIRTRRIVGAEALVRWRSPTRGLVPPDNFIRQLEDMGLGNRLGDWVLDQACRQMENWDRAGLPPVPISINMFPAQFLVRSLRNQIEQTLKDHKLSPHRLEIEILEATAVDDSDIVRENLQALRAMDINVALDDFGTGYSSLFYLTRVPANVLKLDRAFIFDLVNDSRQQAIVSQIIGLAKALNFTVVAEGVEEEPQLAMLATMECDQFQGFLFRHPVTAEAFAELLRSESTAR